jgi:hypothetical protein
MAMSSEAWSAWAAGISAAAAIVVVAWRIAKAQQKTARQQLRATAWSMIAQFDDTLRMYDAERKWVKEQARKSAEDQQKTDSDQLDIAGYMGVFERLNELLGTGPDFVSEKTAHAFYGERQSARYSKEIFANLPEQGHNSGSTTPSRPSRRWTFSRHIAGSAGYVADLARSCAGCEDHGG